MTDEVKELIDAALICRAFYEGDKGDAKYVAQTACEFLEKSAATLTRLSEQNAAKDARIAELEGALKPFVQALEDGADESDEDAWEIWEHPVALGITIGLLKQARAALSESP